MHGGCKNTTWQPDIVASASQADRQTNKQEKHIEYQLSHSFPMLHSTTVVPSYWNRLGRLGGQVVWDGHWLHWLQWLESLRRKGDGRTLHSHILGDAVHTQLEMHQSPNHFSLPLFVPVRRSSYIQSIIPNKHVKSLIFTSVFWYHQKLCPTQPTQPHSMLEPSLLGLPPCHILAKFPQEQSCMIEGRPHSCSPPQLISATCILGLSESVYRSYMSFAHLCNISAPSRLCDTVSAHSSWPTKFRTCRGIGYPVPAAPRII